MHTKNDKISNVLFNKNSSEYIFLNKHWYYQPFSMSQISSSSFKKNKINTFQLKKNHNFATTLMGATNPKIGSLKRDRNESIKLLLNNEFPTENNSNNFLFTNFFNNKIQYNNNVITTLNN